MYERRNEIERWFRRLKGIFRVLSRVETLKVVFVGIILLAHIVDALRWCQHALGVCTP